MRTHRARTWWWFGVAAAVMVSVLTWLTAMLMHLDEGEIEARRMAALHERLRLALWRIDSWIAPQVATESVRPISDYTPFPSATEAWTKGFRPLATGEVVVMSSLLGTESPLFPLHFETREGQVQSPQVPQGNERDVAESRGVAHDVLERAAVRLATLCGRMAIDEVNSRLAFAEQQMPAMGCNPIAAGTPLQTQQSVQEFSNRQLNYQRNAFQSNSRAMPAAPTGTVETAGPMLPIWLEGEPKMLLFVRRIEGTDRRVQGFEVDWSHFQEEALALIGDLFPREAMNLVRCDHPTESEQPMMLASVPARLDVQRDCMVVASGLPMRPILAITWGVALLGLCGLGWTLRTAVGYGDRRARFASAVTHELRTPLTTFRMYSEMLAEGVVKDPIAQQEYLRTLQHESDRLARVVENVLAWSRLEEGRFASRRERVAVDAMIARLTPPLEQRLAEVGMTLTVELAADAEGLVLTTDEDAVGQVLFNLVDNAAKYAVGSTPPTVALRIARAAEKVTFTIADHGPGIPAAVQKRIFAPFDRGARPTATNDVPGVGLGLALARGLARDLGGELRLADAAEGACFVLELPLG